MRPAASPSRTALRLLHPFASMLCAGLFSLGLCGSVFAEDPAPPKVVTPRSEEHVVTSMEGRPYRIMIAVPAEPPPPGGYPVLYFTDANAFFGAASDAARLQRRSGAILTVGVGYPGDELFDPRRTFDFTPPMPQAQLERIPRRPPPEAGGCDLFLKTIEEQVKPLVEKRFKVDRGRQTLFGHSLGGLFVLHVLFTKPESFQTYVAGSPSIWWNDQGILEEEKRFAASTKDVKVDLLIAVGEREKAHMVRDAERMAKRLEALSIRGLRVDYKAFDEEDHITVVHPAIGRAVSYSLDVGPHAAFPSDRSPPMPVGPAETKPAETKPASEAKPATR